MSPGHKKPFVWIICLHTYNTYRGYIKGALSFFLFVVKKLAVGSQIVQHHVALMVMALRPRKGGC